MLVEVHELKRVVVNIHAAVAGIGDVEVALTIDQGTGKAREDRAVGGLDHSHSMGGGRCCSIRQTYIRVPCGDRPVKRGKDEIGWLARRQDEIGCAAVGDDARGRAGRLTRVIRICGWDGDDQGLFLSWAVVQASDSLPIPSN